MAFVLAKETDAFPYPVTIPVVTAKGVRQSHRIELIFKRLSRAEINALQPSIEDEGDSLERDTDYVMAIAEDWKGVNGPDGSAIPFSRESVRDLLDFAPSAALAIVRAFTEATNGGGAKRGN